MKMSMVFQIVQFEKKKKRVGNATSDGMRDFELDNVNDSFCFRLQPFTLRLAWRPKKCVQRIMFADIR